MALLPHSGCHNQGCKNKNEHSPGFGCLPEECVVKIFVFLHVGTIISLAHILPYPQMIMATLRMELWNEKNDGTNLAELQELLGIWSSVGFQYISAPLKRLTFNKIVNLFASDANFDRGINLNGTAICVSAEPICVNLASLDDILKFACNLGIIVQFSAITHTMGSEPLMPHEVIHICERLVNGSQLELDLNLQTVDVCSTAAVENFAEILKLTKKMTIAKLKIRDHELSAISEYIPKGAVFNQLHVIVTGPYLQDVTLLGSLFTLSKKCVSIFFNNSSPSEEFVLRNENKFRGGALCGKVTREQNWNIIVKFITKLLHLPKCAAAILFAQTYDD